MREIEIENVSANDIIVELKCPSVIQGVELSIENQSANSELQNCTNAL